MEEVEETSLVALGVTDWQNAMEMHEFVMDRRGLEGRQQSIHAGCLVKKVYYCQLDRRNSDDTQISCHFRLARNATAYRAFPMRFESRANPLVASVDGTRHPWISLPKVLFSSNHEMYALDFTLLDRRYGWIYSRTSSLYTASKLPYLFLSVLLFIEILSFSTFDG